MVTIEKVSNGYIMHLGSSTRTVYLTLDEVLQRLLSYYEGRFPTAKGDAYGLVIVERTPVRVTSPMCRTAAEETSIFRVD